MAKRSKKATVPHRHKGGQALFFERAVTIPATATTPAAFYEASKWYDNVSPEHAAAAGAAALPMKRDHDCGCWLLEADGRAVVTRTVEVPDFMPDGQPYQRPEVRVSIEAHECEED